MGQLITNGSTADAYGTKYGGWSATQTLLSGCESSGDQDNDFLEMHSFFFFDTSSIGASATVTGVRFDCYFVQVTGNIGQNALYLYIGNNTIGSTWSTADYEVTIGSGQLMGSWSGKALSTVGARYKSSTSSAICAEVSKTAYTNFETDVVWGGGLTNPSYCYIAAQEYTPDIFARPKLTVDYTTGVIPRLTLLGVGCQMLGIANGIATVRQIFEAL